MLKLEKEFQNLIAQVQLHLEQHFKQPFADKKPLIIIGLSGGPDSVFLLHLFAELVQRNLIKIVAAHLDHGWRADSAHDVAWCKQLCHTLNIEFYAEHAQNISHVAKPNGSQEALGRTLRRTFFKNLADKLNADLITLGHHADDQQETFFLRLMRGTSLNGLRCMDTFSGIYFRPLLGIDKRFILEYLNEQKIEYLVDPTNESSSYLRNRIRHQVIPVLRACDKRFDAKLQSSIERLQEEDDFLQELAQKKIEELFTHDPKTKLLVGNLAGFQAMHHVLQKRVLVIWLVQFQARFTPQHSFLLEILKFLNSPHGGAHYLHETWFIKKESKRFWLALKINN